MNESLLWDAMVAHDPRLVGGDGPESWVLAETFFAGLILGFMVGALIWVPAWGCR